MHPDLYRRLYADPTIHYGDANYDRSPGVRYLPLFKDFIKGDVIDLGCGRGQLIERLEAEGVGCFGVDQVCAGPRVYVADITHSLPFNDFGPFGTAVCIDVVEHLEAEQLPGLFDNLLRFERQVISVHSGSAREIGFEAELHLNQQPVDAWEKLLGEHFNVVKRIDIEADRALFLCERRQDAVERRVAKRKSAAI